MTWVYFQPYHTVKQKDHGVSSHRFVKELHICAKKTTPARAKCNKKGVDQRLGRAITHSSIGVTVWKERAVEVNQVSVGSRERWQQRDLFRPLSESSAQDDAVEAASSSTQVLFAERRCTCLDSATSMRNARCPSQRPNRLNQLPVHHGLRICHQTRRCISAEAAQPSVLTVGGRGSCVFDENKNNDGMMTETGRSAC